MTLGANGLTLARVRRAEALAYAESVRAEVEAGLARGHDTTRALAAWLNSRGVGSRHSALRSPASAARLLSLLSKGWVHFGDQSVSLSSAGIGLN